MHNLIDQNILILTRMADGSYSQSNMLVLIIFQYQAVKRQFLSSPILFIEEHLYISTLSQ
jgi:hypothetical protein